jgi:hypothetical protein
MHTYMTFSSRESLGEARQSDSVPSSAVIGNFIYQYDFDPGIFILLHVYIYMHECVYVDLGANVCKNRIIYAHIVTQLRITNFPLF